MTTAAATIRGFNYWPVAARTEAEVWEQYDPAQVERELAQIREHFPVANVIRLWLSWAVFDREPARFTQRFEHALATAAGVGLRVMPVLFNRWHDNVEDYGGIYIDHFLPQASWLQRPDLFGPYLDAVVGGHANDERVLAWDLCNEPFAYFCPPEAIEPVYAAECAWLAGVHARCRQLGVRAPLTVGCHGTEPGDRSLRRVNDWSDWLSLHAYYTPNSRYCNHDTPAGFQATLDTAVDYARRVGKPLVVTETGWGALDDRERARNLAYELGEMNRRGLGWIICSSHHSRVVNCRRPEFGRTGTPGYMGCIEPDGSLRLGHEVINQFH